jgi:uncharacterized phage-associated protein
LGVPVSAQAVANAIIKMAQQEGRAVTNMQVQKHVFLGQGYCLALLGHSLYHQNTHAWQWGPVVPKLYKALQQYGSGMVTSPIKAEDELGESTDEYGVLKGVWEAYRRYSGSQLSALTHRPNSPWSKTWESNRFGVIPTDDIQQYFLGLISSRK